jgi:hypothetical protein
MSTHTAASSPMRCAQYPGPIVAGSCFRRGAGGEVRGSFSETVRREFCEIADEFRRSAGLRVVMHVRYSTRRL